MPDLPLGKIPNLSAKEYHAADAVSNSKLSAFIERPELYRRRFVEKSLEIKPTQAMKFGIAFHSLVLDNEEDYQFVVSPYENFKKKEAQDWRDAQEANGVTVLSKDEYDLALSMKKALDDPKISLWLEGAEREVTWRSKSDDFPLTLQCRTDLWHPTRLLNVDVKTVQSLGDGDWWGRHATDLGYHRQQAFYESILGVVTGKPVTTAFVCVEKAEPHRAAVYSIHKDTVELGLVEVVRALERLADCHTSGHWPDYADLGVIEGVAPGFYRETFPC